MFVFQSTFSTIDFKQENNECKSSVWKPKRVYTSKPFLLHNLSPIIKYFDSRVVFEFNTSVLAAENTNYATTVVNAYIFYELVN